MSVQLYGCQYSVYAWIARFALHEKRVNYRWREGNPFTAGRPAGYLATHPLRHEPTLIDGNFTLFETGAITRYVDEAFKGPILQPSAPKARARVNQIISIVDSYVYRPLVNHVFSHVVMGPWTGHSPPFSDYQQGLATAPRILHALDLLVSDEGFMVGETLTLADIHLAPMMSYFTSSNDGLNLLKQQEQLYAWWTKMSRCPTFADSMPKLPELSA